LDHLVERDDLNIRKIEIDEIKRQKYGTTAKCRPEVDFEEAGKQAAEFLRNGINVAVEEAFCDKAHIDFALKGANMDASDPRLLIIRLECSVGTAMERKKEQLDPRIVGEQYCRVVEDVEDEIAFDTEEYCIEEIADTIVKRIT